MLVETTVPQTPQSRDSVVAGPFARLEGNSWISSDTPGGDVQTLGRGIIFGRIKTGYGDELVIGIERRLMTLGAAFGLEDCLTAAGQVIKRVRTLRLLQRADIQAERIHGLVRRANANLRRIRREHMVGAKKCRRRT